ncbi:hypothetical protein SH2C18_14040 [Clostridium sediminicola]|uniref:hypothetical protein n=1 Tax=Clostridium sediminicola TaxID=3114879 RepID=UPI0031F26E88
MKKIKILIAVLAISVMTICYINLKSKNTISSKNVSIATTSEKTQYDFEDYFDLIGLNKENLLAKIDETPISLDENFQSFSRETFGLGFPELQVSVWFENFGDGPVDQVYIYNKNIDINGVKIGNKISKFKKAFEKSLPSAENSPYANFEYKNKLISVYYNIKTEETYGVYVMEKSKIESSYIEYKDNRYEVAGINDPIEFQKVFNTVKELVSNGDKERVAEYILYPLNVYASADKPTLKIENKEEFIKNYDKIFNEQVKTALANQKVEETFVNYQGVMVKNGEIWFGAISANNSSPQQYKIIAINHI